MSLCLLLSWYPAMFSSHEYWTIMMTFCSSVRKRNQPARPCRAAVRCFLMQVMRPSCLIDAATSKLSESYSSDESPSRNLLSAGSEGMPRAYRPQPLQQKQRTGHPRPNSGMAALSTARRVGSARTSIEGTTLYPTLRDQLY